MEIQIAKQLIQRAVVDGTCWADLGAGSGTFSLALSELLGPQGKVIAVDKEALITRSSSKLKSAPIQSYTADFTHPLTLPPLDGILMANSLHFVARQTNLLEKLLTYLSPKGSFLLIEYDRRLPSPWIPYPIPRKKGQRIFQELGLKNLQIIGTTPSKYGNGEIYALWGEK